MVSGDGHEYERKSSLPLASRGGGGQFCIPPLLGEHGLCAWQGRGAEPGLFARPCEVCSCNFRRALLALIPFARLRDARDPLSKFGGFASIGFERRFTMGLF